MPTNKPGPAEQFDDLVQQRQADLAGMWLFLTTELLLFGGWFTGLIIARVQHPTGFNEAAGHLDLLSSTINMGVLLTSSLTSTLAAKAAAAARRPLTLGFLFTTMALGALYLAIQAYEWNGVIDQQLMPWLGLPFHYSGQQPQAAEQFFNYYFLLTGLHSIHLLIGLVIFSIIAVVTIRWREPSRLARQIEISGLYWVFISVIGIFLFILLYLLRT